MKQDRILSAVLGLVLAAGAWAGYGGLGPSDEEATWVRDHVGMYVWGPPREKELVCYEGAALGSMVARLGARIGRMALGMHPEPWRPDYDPTRRSFLDSVRRLQHRTLIERCDIIIFTLADGSGRQFDPAWTREHYRRLTEYLLREYRDVAKTFVLGLWECDHWLTEADMAADPSAVEKYSRYFAARHEGIAAGRAAAPPSRSRVVEMIELVSVDYEGKEGLINRVIPGTRADLYSLSSWRYQDELTRALDYIKTRAPDSADYGNRNCMIGEAGGPPGWAPPSERVEKMRQILAQARQWGVAYLIWWELVGSLGNVDSRPLRTPAYEGGAKLAPYYWFHRAYHNEDDPLVVEDFEEDPYGPAGGDYSEEGFSLNCLGGRHGPAGGVFCCMVPGGARGHRSLYLSFLPGGGRWGTDLLRLDARRFRELRLALRGPDPATLTLTDAEGHSVSQPLPGPDAGASMVWRDVAISLTNLPGINLADLAELSVEADDAAVLQLDDIVLAAAGSLPAQGAKAPPAVEAAHVSLDSARQPLPLPGRPEDRLSWLRIMPARGHRLRNPTLTDGTTTVTLASELVPGQVLELVPGGTSYLRFGPLGSLLDVTQPQTLGLHAHELNAQPRYHTFLPVGDGTRSWLEWRWESASPVRHFRIALYGVYNHEWQARAAILVSRDGETWTEVTAGRRNWDEPCWIGRTPEGFEPTRRLWVRCQLFPDLSRPDPPWTISLSDLKIELWLDSEDVALPGLRGLEYRDDGHPEGFRGLLDADW